MSTKATPTALEQLQKELQALHDWISTGYDFLAESRIEPGAADYNGLLNVILVRLQALTHPKN